MVTGYSQLIVSRCAEIFRLRTILVFFLSVSLTGCLLEPKLIVKPATRINRHFHHSGQEVYHEPGISPEEGIDTTECSIEQIKWTLKQAQISRLFHSHDAVLHYRRALQSSLKLMQSLEGFGEFCDCCHNLQKIQTLSNQALLGLMRSGGFGEGKSAAMAAERLMAVGVELYSSPGFMEDFELDELWFASDYQTIMVQDPFRESGLGLPMIAYRGPRPREGQVPESFFPPHWKFAVTAVARLDGDPVSGAGDRLAIELVDPLESETVRIGQMDYSIARDLTTPVIHLLSHSGYRDKARQGLFRPQTLTSEEGITMVHPHRPGRIPFILIHGMGCSPRIMADIVNSVHADPELRSRYQIMIVYYTTGDTILQDANVIRTAFRMMRNYYDPAYEDSSWDQAVVLGHSLGGPIARILTSYSDQNVEQMLFTRPWQNLVMSEPLRRAAEPAIFFEPLPELRRAIYLAGTMRGSRIADQVEARALSRVLPRRQQLKQFHDEIAMNNGIEVFQPEYRERIPSSIDNQSPESPLLEVANRLRQDPRLISHSIQANATPLLPVHHSTDLLVPYFSSFVEEASSSLVLHGQDHFCTHDPRTLAEIRRILKLNLSENTSWQGQ